MAQTHEIVSHHYFLSPDMTSRCPLFWRAFLLLIFGPNVQAQATVLEAFKTAKIEEVTMFMKLFGPRNDYGQLLRNIGFDNLKN